ncbi:LPS assembly protein LptD [Amaricoccus sp.]|uniref:LPS-assembly protein LptD n=1 Tax=Amaricoccus sp. TaxID=1872485 RepID=UPI0026211FAE|nr:LPS assembly protein LptD [uncultured Amaricoccus sp.]
MSQRGRFIAFGLALAVAATGLRAQSPEADQPPASLIADEVTYDRETGLLVATGDVEVLYEGRVLKATSITYDEKADRIRAVGPIQITDPERGILLADSADLSADITDGLIESAQLLIAGQLQLAAAEARRSQGRYTTLYRAIASSCTICEGNPTPTWAIRAARVTQDAEAKRIFFENATLEVYGVPVGYLPRLSIPDPSVGRASGVLVPVGVNSNIFGLGLKIPYYWALSPAADATVTPFFTTTGAKLFEGEYRQRYANGGFDFNGVVALDDGLGGTPGRGAAFAVGEFALGDFGLGEGFVTDFDLALASDDTFLQQFDYSDSDLLTSTARILRNREHDYFELGTVAFQSLRENEDTASIPFVLPEFTYHRLFDAPMVGGRMSLDAQALGIIRQDGQDALRGGGDIDWRRVWTLPQGVLATAGAIAGFDIYRVWDDPDQSGDVLFRTDPNVNFELRWPLMRASGRAAHVIEPIVQVIYSDTLGEDDVPNNDSTLVEFDETNLFALNRFPGEDRIETGLRANVGLGYTRYDPAGWSLGVVVGQVFRAKADPDFYESTGLAGQSSDVVAAVSVNFGTALSLVNRALFDTDFSFNRNEFAMTYEQDRGALRAAYVYLAEGYNPYYGAQPETNEFGLDARYRVMPNWEVRGLWRYDVVTGANLRAGGGLTYGNDCAEFDLSVSRRYTSSTNVPPSTSVGFSVRLAGLGGSSERKWPAGVCAARKT